VFDLVSGEGNWAKRGLPGSCLVVVWEANADYFPRCWFAACKVWLLSSVSVMLVAWSAVIVVCMSSSRATAVRL
jgi:hypothetical protein